MTQSVPRTSLLCSILLLLFLNSVSSQSNSPMPVPMPVIRPSPVPILLPMYSSLSVPPLTQGSPSLDWIYFSASFYTPAGAPQLPQSSQGGLSLDWMDIFDFFRTPPDAPQLPQSSQGGSSLDQDFSFLSLSHTSPIPVLMPHISHYTLYFTSCIIVTSGRRG